MTESPIDFQIISIHRHLRTAHGSSRVAFPSTQNKSEKEHGCTVDDMGRCPILLEEDIHLHVRDVGTTYYLNSF